MSTDRDPAPDFSAEERLRLAAALDAGYPFSSEPWACGHCHGTGLGPMQAYGPFEKDGKVEFVLKRHPCKACGGTGVDPEYEND